MDVTTPTLTRPGANYVLKNADGLFLRISEKHKRCWIKTRSAAEVFEGGPDLDAIVQHEGCTAEPTRILV